MLSNETDCSLCLNLSIFFSTGGDKSVQDRKRIIIIYHILE